MKKSILLQMLKRKSRKYGLVIRTSLQNQLAYTINFAVGTLFFAFILFVFLMLWTTIYRSGESRLNGYSLNQIVWYFILTELIYQSSGSIFQELNQDIKGGSIAYLLNKPYHYLAYQFSECLGQMTMKTLFQLPAGLLLGLLWMGPLEGFRLSNLIPVIFSCILGIFVNFFMMACIGLTAFWVEENTPFYWIFQKLTFMLGMFLPVEFFPGWLQKITRFLPFSYITYGPARLGVKFSWVQFFQIVPVQAAYLLLFLFLAMGIYRKGVRYLNVNGG